MREDIRVVIIYVCRALTLTGIVDNSAIGWAMEMPITVWNQQLFFLLAM